MKILKKNSCPHRESGVCPIFSLLHTVGRFHTKDGQRFFKPGMCYLEFRVLYTKNITKILIVDIGLKLKIVPDS
jgi:hypothetical protein